MDRYTYKVALAYDGARFAGFARQPGQRTIEAELCRALAPLVPGLESVAVGGRTDRGVSATGQVISFWSHDRLDPRAIEAAIDASAPGEIIALGAGEVPRWFHAQHSARLRRYRYTKPHEGEDVPRLGRMLSALAGRHDFTAYARDTPPDKKTIRTLREASARAAGSELHLTFAADGFLRNQIRVLVATALRELARPAPDEILLQLLRTQDRRQTAPPAPAANLILTQIIYAPHP